MELPQYRKDQELTPLEEGDAGNVEARDPQLKIRAGHISLSEHGHSGEISLNDKPNRPLHLPKMPDVEVSAGTFAAPNGPAFQPVQFNAAPKPQETATQPQESEQPQVARHDRSAWHEIGLDADGKVIETPHGYAFQQETQPEQMMQAAASAVPSQDQQSPQQSGVQAVPPAAPVQPQQPPQPQSFPQQPMSTPQAQPMPVAQPQYPQQNPNPQQPQPIYQQPGYNPAQVPQYGAQPPQQPGYPHMPQLSGAVNPSYQPHPGQAALPTGQSTHADPQHMLAQPRRFSFNWKSPWLWLAVGLGMIIYFGSQLF